MTRPTTTGAEGETLLHCSTDRILLVSTSAGGAEELIKILERGTLGDAQREVALGRRLKGLGVVRYLAAETDSRTGKPCVRMARHRGNDLETLVADGGALAPAQATRALAQVARTLAGMHGIEAPDAPCGLVHGDVKAGNVLLGPDGALLLDLEKTTGRPSRSATAIPDGTFTGGTHGFSPPEAYAGHPVDAPFDAYGLGVTLHFAVTGTLPRPGSLAGHDPDLRRLVAECTSSDPARRRSLDSIADTLEALADRLERDPAEDVLGALYRADLDAARRVLQQLPDGHARRTDLDRLLERRNALLQRIEPPGVEADPGTDTMRLAGTLVSVQAFLRRFPRHIPSLELRRRVRSATARLLLEAPVRVAELTRLARYAEARSFLQGCLALVDTLLDQPGRFQVPGDGSPRMPGVLQRSPRRFLARTLREVDNGEAAHRRMMEELEVAERDLDLVSADAVVDGLAEVYGGASPVTARYKDRLHRLGFYVERLAWSRARLDRFADVLRLTSGEVDLRPLYALVDRCRQRVLDKDRDVTAGIGMRGLQLTLRDLADDFPSHADQARSAMRCLHDSLVEATRIAWRLLAEAGEKLASEPVPVRPLQSILNRLDTLRLVEVYLDLPDQPRSALLDRIEAVRMKVEQARATRDRIARGAEQAMARGHWTTGLFDMERAVGHLEGDASEEEAPESRRLLDRLEAAKRRKQEIEQAARHNVELASRYAMLQDAPDSPVEDRLELLDQRRESLRFLVRHVPTERAELYARDLRELEVLVAQEHASQAEMTWDATDDPNERLAIARRVVAMLEPQTGGIGEPVGRVQRMIEHWRRQEEQAGREVNRLAEERRAERRRTVVRRRLGVAAGAVGLVVVAALSMQVLAGENGNAALAEELDRRLGTEPRVATIAADPMGAIGTLRQAADLLDAEPVHPAAAPAVALAEALRAPAGPPEQVDLGYWSRHFTEQFGVYAGSVRAWDAKGSGARAVRASLERLGVRLWRTGVTLAVLADGRADAVDAWLRDGDRLAEQLQAAWLRLPPTFAADLRALVQ